ncbi:diacylglycerol/lipid kinase family protein [Mogibacterium neglectum]|uniref:diacylglycerol/lipid kinase family protein n=1 Tax=Mogibacterium neglectum TaxID=114528 RepID=UPI00272A9B5D|nr:diacylglycerol kinase family protein [Mogibacterium neglectum]
MKYAFIINPIAGNGKKVDKLCKDISAAALDSEFDIELHYTTGPSSATHIADKVATAAERDGEEVRIYACGGDGTVNEVANGVYGHVNAALGIVPIGSGNDLIRNFGGSRATNYKDIMSQLLAEEEVVDVMSFSYRRDGEDYNRIGLNAFNIGFDGNVAILASYLNKKTFIGGSLSYGISIFLNLIEKSGQNLQVTIDGEQLFKGPLMMCTIGNGRFCGGGIEISPKAKLDDGLLDVLVVHKIPRRTVLKVLPKFSKGKLDEIKGIEKITEFKQGRKINIVPRNGHMKFVVDGEITETDEITIEIKDRAMRVLVPYLQV